MRKTRTVTFEVHLDKDERGHPGDTLRDLLVAKVWDELVAKRFKVGSGSYEVTVRRKIGDEP